MHGYPPMRQVAMPIEGPDGSDPVANRISTAACYSQTLIDVPCRSLQRRICNPRFARPFGAFRHEEQCVFAIASRVRGGAGLRRWAGWRFSRREKRPVAFFFPSLVVSDMLKRNSCIVERHHLSAGAIGALYYLRAFKGGMAPA